MNILRALTHPRPLTNDYPRPIPGALECEADQFTCHGTVNDSRHCIPLNWVCDNEKDCADGSDERSCSE